jgi:hypothetical protein
MLFIYLMYLFIFGKESEKKYLSYAVKELGETLDSELGGTCGGHPHQHGPGGSWQDHHQRQRVHGEIQHESPVRK